MKHAHAALLIARELSAREQPDPVEALRELEPEAARALRARDGEQVKLDVFVTNLVPELGKVKVTTEDGVLSVSLSSKTPGVDVRALRLGQHLKMTLQGVLAPRVLSAALA